MIMSCRITHCCRKVWMLSMLKIEPSIGNHWVRRKSSKNWFPNVLPRWHFTHTEELLAKLNSNNSYRQFARNRDSNWLWCQIKMNLVPKHRTAVVTHTPLARVRAMAMCRHTVSSTAQVPWSITRNRLSCMWRYPNTRNICCRLGEYFIKLLSPMLKSLWPDTGHGIRTLQSMWIIDTASKRRSIIRTKCQAWILLRKNWRISIGTIWTSTFVHAATLTTHYKRYTYPGIMVIRYMSNDSLMSSLFLQNLKYWRYRMYLLPKEHPATKKIMESPTLIPCDIYTENANENAKQQVDDFMRFVETYLNKNRKIHCQRVTRVSCLSDQWCRPFCKYICSLCMISIENDVTTTYLKLIWNNLFSLTSSQGWDMIVMSQLCL